MIYLIHWFSKHMHEPTQKFNERNIPDINVLLIPQ